MTAPTIIERMIESYRDRVSILSDGSNYFNFPIIEGGKVKDESNVEGTITSTSPLTVEDSSGNELSAPFTPIYPYFKKGSIVKIVDQITSETERFPLIILDTLDRPETVSEQFYNLYDLRLFVVMDANTANYSDQYELYFDNGLDDLADWTINAIHSIRSFLFTEDGKTYRELWGDSDKYGNGGKDTLSIHSNAIEITGGFLYNKKQNCI